MYGFVNQAVRDFVVQHHSEEVWQAIKAAAGIELTHFVSDKVYEDGLTFAMVGAIAEELSITVDEALHAFGEYWVPYIDSQGFGALLSANGATLLDFLGNLDRLHSRLAAAYPEFLPPEFKFSDRGADGVSLVYSSSRKGLVPMVAGIIQGLANRYDTQIHCDVRPNDDGAEFLISLVGEPVAG